MVLPAPAAGDRAPGHGAQGALDPDRGIDMNDPDQDGADRAQRMDDRRQPLLVDRGVGLEIDVPQNDATAEQQQDQDRLAPEDELLAGIVLAELGQALLAVVDHRAEVLHPHRIVAVPQVEREEAEEETQEAEEQYHADPGMDRPGHLP